MAHPILPLALVAAAAVLAPAPATGPTYAPQRPRLASGVAQQAYFARRLIQTGQRIDQRQRAGLIASGPATFMRQDLARVRDGVGRTFARGVALKPGERDSYDLMLRRVERRIAAAERRSRSVGE